MLWAMQKTVEEVEYPRTNTGAVIPKDLQKVTTEALKALEDEVGNFEEAIAEKFGKDFLL